MPDFSFERDAGGFVAGIDEAGRGPWAGPVVAAAVVLLPGTPEALLTKIDDSKKLTEARREALFEPLQAVAEIGVGRASVEEIDALNILKATHLAMRRALAALPRMPDVALVDGNSDPGLNCRTQLLVKGDGRSYSIAAASIIAKVSRDREMVALARALPGYGFEKHKGYGTQTHQDALAHLGPSAAHRTTFAPIRALIERGPT